MPWSKNRCNSLPCSDRTFRQCSCNQRVVVCNSWDGSAFGPSERSDPTLLPTVRLYILYFYLAKSLLLCIVVELCQEVLSSGRDKATEFMTE